MLNRLKIGLKYSQLLGILAAWLPAQTIQAAADHWQLNMYKGVTPLSKDTYHLHMVGLMVCIIIGVVVFGLMFYSLIHHRKSKGYIPATFHDNPRLEVVWSIIPFLILIGLAVPATRVLMRMDDSSLSQITVKVVGHQWRWQYQYLDQGISFFSTLSTPYDQIQNKQKKGPWYLLEVDHPLVLPVNKKIRFLVTSNDVIHSWWVPELGIKRDAIPGFMYEAWAIIEKQGTYRGQCAELCGVNHGFMPIVVKAVSQEEFDSWVAAQGGNTKGPNSDKAGTTTLATKPDLEKDKTHLELMSSGKKKYEQLCAACHQADGLGIPPMYPALKGSSVAVGGSIKRHIDLILNGIPGSAMQSYKEQLSDEDIAAITTYERNAWENNTENTVQPKDVAARRQTGQKPSTTVHQDQTGGSQ